MATVPRSSLCTRPYSTSACVLKEIKKGDNASPLRRSTHALRERERERDRKREREKERERQTSSELPQKHTEVRGSGALSRVSFLGCKPYKAPETHRSCSLEYGLERRRKKEGERRGRNVLHVGESLGETCCMFERG